MKKKIPKQSYISKVPTVLSGTEFMRCYFCINCSATFFQKSVSHSDLNSQFELYLFNRIKCDIYDVLKFVNCFHRIVQMNNKILLIKEQRCRGAKRPKTMYINISFSKNEFDFDSEFEKETSKY